MKVLNVVVDLSGAKGGSDQRDSDRKPGMRTHARLIHNDDVERLTTGANLNRSNGRGIHIHVHTYTHTYTD